jgi:hypothetical protein
VGQTGGNALSYQIIVRPWEESKNNVVVVMSLCGYDVVLSRGATSLFEMNIMSILCYLRETVCW